MKIKSNITSDKEKQPACRTQASATAGRKELVEEKQKEILDSIRYAKRIQTALITSEKYIERNINRLSDKD